MYIYLGGYYFVCSLAGVVIVSLHLLRIVLLS